MDCIITFKISFKILGTLTLQAFLNEFKNRLKSALLQGGPFQNVQCLLAAHSTSHYPSSTVLEGFKLCLFDSNLSIKPVKKFFVYKCKLSLSLALLCLVDLFINKLKTKFNNLFYRMILNTKRIHNSFWGNFPARAKQMPSKVLIVNKKKRRPRPPQNCNRWQQYLR